MKTIWLKPLRDLRRMKIRAVTVTVMVAFGVSIYAGMYMSRDTLVHTRDAFYHDLHLSDLRVVITPSDPSELPSLERVSGLARYEKRLVIPGSIEMKDGRALNSLIVYRDPATRAGVNELRILEGDPLDPERARGVVIERSLHDVHGYRLEDSMTLNPYTMPMDVSVLGVGVTPEWLIATVDSTVFFPMKGSLGLVYAPMALVQEVFGYPLYNEISFLLKDGVNREAVEAQLLDLLNPLGIETVIRKEEEFTYRFLEESLKGFSAFLPSLVVVFLLVIFLVTSITTHRLLATQRWEIGVLRSLGYRRREIAGSYLLLALILCAIGGLLGAAFSHVINILFAGRYAFALGLPGVLPVFVPSYLLQGWLMATGVVMIAFFVPFFRLVRHPPQEIIRGDRKEGFTGLHACFTGSGRLFSRFVNPGISFRFGVRNLFRRAGLTAATTLSVALSVALGSSLLIVLHSVEAY